MCPSGLLLSQHLDVFVELGRTECLGKRVARDVVGRQVLYFAYLLLLQVIDICSALQCVLSWGVAVVRPLASVVTVARIELLPASSSATCASKVSLAVNIFFIDMAPRDFER